MQYNDVKNFTLITEKNLVVLWEKSTPTAPGE